jgi:hypothetical protein
MLIFCRNLLKGERFSLYMPWRHTGGAEVQLHSFLTSALHGSERSVSTPGKNSVTYWTGGWMGPWTRLHISEKRIFFCPCRDSKPAPPALVFATLAHNSDTQRTAPPGATSHSTEQHPLVYTSVRTPDNTSNGDFQISREGL